MALSEEDVEKSIVAAREAHDKYRASGLGLSALIVTVSSAAAYKVFPESSYIAFVLPIILALLHQTAHYVGSMYHAKSMYYWAAFNAHLLRKNSKGMEDNSAKAHTQFDVANGFFSLSEYLCLSAVVVFCFLLLWSVSELENSMTAIVLSGILCLIVGLCWKFRKVDLFSKISD
jgi:hypothetical protein